MLGDRRFHSRLRLRCGDYTAHGWSGTDLGQVARNYADFASYRPEVRHLAGFQSANNLGLRVLPESVRQTHRE